MLTVLLICVGCKPVPSPEGENGSEELVLLTHRGKELKVLQFTDMHFGEEGTTYHNADVKRTLAFIDYAIQTEQPDLIVLLGDNMMSQGVDGAKFLVQTFDQYKIPYTLIYGIKMDGIILGFCPQTGFTHNSTRPCSTFSYTIGADFEMHLHLVVEPQSAN